MYLIKVGVGLRSLQVEFLFVPVIHTSQQLIEHMEVPLLIGLEVEKNYLILCLRQRIRNQSTYVHPHNVNIFSFGIK